MKLGVYIRTIIDFQKDKKNLRKEDSTSDISILEKFVHITLIH